MVTKQFQAHTELKASDLNGLVQEINDGFSAEATARENAIQTLGQEVENGIKTKATIADLDNFRTTGAVLPLNAAYVFRSTPVHGISGHFDVTGQDFIAFCIAHEDYDHTDHTVMLYLKSGNDYKYSGNFDTDDADTPLEKFIAKCFFANVATQEADGLMSKEDKKTLDGMQSEIDTLGSNVDNLYKNKLDVSKSEFGYIRKADGNIYDDPNNKQYKTSAFIKIESGSSFAFSVGSSSPNKNLRFVGFYADNNVDSYLGEASIQENVTTFTAPSNANYVRITYYASSLTPQLEKGTTATSYVEYGVVDANRVSAITEENITDSSVGANKLKDNAVISSKIASKAITKDKMGDDVVGELNSISVTSDKSVNASRELDRNSKYAANIEYVNKAVNITTGELSADSPTRAAGELVSIPYGSTFAPILSSGYIARYFLYDENKNFVKVVDSIGDIKTERYVRPYVYKNPSTQNISPEEAKTALQVRFEASSPYLKWEIGKNKFDKSKATKGFIAKTPPYGITVVDGYWTSDYIDVSQFANKVCVSPRFRVYLEYDENKEPIASTLIHAETANAKITPDSNTKFIKISVFNSDLNNVQVEDANSPTSFVGYSRVSEKGVLLNEEQRQEVIEIAESDNKLNEKIGLSVGDSIMAGDGNSFFGVLDILAEKYGCVVNDYSKGGSTCADHRDDNNRGFIVEQIQRAISDGVQPDFILIDGASNDMMKSTLGTLTDSYDYVTQGYITFVGGLEYCFGLLRDNFPTIPVLYFLPHSTPSRAYATELTFGNMARDICKKWSVPMADIYRDGNMNTRILGMKEAFTPDATHPNRAGYEHAYIPIIKDWLNKLL